MMYRDISSDPSRVEATVTEGRKVVAVVGIDRYRAWPPLTNAVSDAHGALGLFQHLGFEQLAPPLIDETATGDAIHRLVTDDLATLGSDDSLVLFFAGHGHTQTRTLQSGPLQTGFLIPFDGDSPDGRAASWLRLDSWLSDVARLPPRHILVILDACHSGLALGSLIKWRGAADPVQRDALEALRRRQSRRVITSALGDQRAMDGGPITGHSLFTGCLIEGLTGGLARDGNREVTGSEIGVYVQQRVTGYSASMQTPDFGTLELDNRGELVLPVTTLDQVPVAPLQSGRRSRPASAAIEFRPASPEPAPAPPARPSSSAVTSAPAVAPAPAVTEPNPIVFGLLKLCFPLWLVAPRLTSAMLRPVAVWLSAGHRWAGALVFVSGSAALSTWTTPSPASTIVWLVVLLLVAAVIVIGRAVPVAPRIIRSFSAAALRRKGWTITVAVTVAFGLFMGATVRSGFYRTCSEKLAAAHALQQASRPSGAVLLEAAKACQDAGRRDDAREATEAARRETERAEADRQTAERTAAERKIADRKASFDKAIANAEGEPVTAEGAAAAVNFYQRAMEIGALDAQQAAQFAIRLQAWGNALMAKKDYAAAISAFEQAKLQDPAIDVDASLAAARAAQRKRGGDPANKRP